MREGTKVSPQLPAGTTLRLLEAPRLLEYAKKPEYDMPSDFVEDFARSKDVCIGAFEGQELSSYTFFGRCATAIDEHLEFSYPKNFVYLYKAFTIPERRGRGLNSLPTAGLDQTGDWLSGAENIVCLVDAYNEASLRSFAKQGFKPAGAFHMVYGLWGGWALPHPKMRSRGFGLRACKQR